MKASATIPFLFLFAAACTDAPTAPTGLTPPTSSHGALRGNPPPPPADAMVSVCAVGCVVLEGTYFSNGADAGLTAAITQFVEGACAFPEATSWLKFGNHQTDALLGATASSNAQIRCHNGKAAGNGKIQYERFGQTVVIQFRDVVTFYNSPECSVESPFCATFTATYTVDGVEGGVATGQAFNREFYEENCDVGEGGTPYCGGID